MRKYFLVLATIFGLCLFTGLAVAQSSTSPNSETQGTIHNGVATNPGDANASSQSPNATSSQSGSGSVSSQSSSSSSTGVQADQSNSSVNSSSSSTPSASSSSDMTSQKTMEGCLVKESSDYFIQPVSGEREKLNSTEDLTSKVGKQVRVEGSEMTSMAANSASSSPSTSANSTTGSGSAETQNNSAGSIAGNAGSSNATGTGASASSSSNNTKEFQVTKIETVSESCPASSQK